MYEYILYLFSSDWTLEEPRYLCQYSKNIFLHKYPIFFWVKTHFFLAVMMINDKKGFIRFRVTI